ncbi:MAG: hypothetical protein RL087_1448, partial [Pseudomonadota bacterium]
AREIENKIRESIGVSLLPAGSADDDGEIDE